MIIFVIFYAAIFAAQTDEDCVSVCKEDRIKHLDTSAQSLQTENGQLKLAIEGYKACNHGSCNNEERLKLLEFTEKQTEYAQQLQKENADLKIELSKTQTDFAQVCQKEKEDLKTELTKTQSELSSCRADMVLGRDKYGEALQKNKLALTLPKWYKTWSVKFDIRPFGSLGVVANVLHVTTGDNCCGVDSRIPGIWLDKLSSSLYVAVSANGALKGANFPPLALHEWSTVEVSQSKMSNSSGHYIIKVTINAKEHVMVINSDPQEFENVLVYNADPWHLAGAALTRNLEVHTNPN